MKHLMIVVDDADGNWYYTNKGNAMSKDKLRTKEEILASLQYHLNEAHRLTELMKDKIKEKLNGNY